jgi:hypothetical protein
LKVTVARAALAVVGAFGATRLACTCVSFVRQPEAGERHARQAGPELLECGTAGDGLGEAFGEFIEFVVHGFVFVVVQRIELGQADILVTESTVHLPASCPRRTNVPARPAVVVVFKRYADSAAAIFRIWAIRNTLALLPGRDGLFRQAETGQRHAREPKAEFLKRLTPCDRLGQAFGKFIELVVHRLVFVRLIVLLHLRRSIVAARSFVKLVHRIGCHNLVRLTDSRRTCAWKNPMSRV